MMVTRECTLPGVRKVSKGGLRDTKLTFRRTDLKTIDVRGGSQHYDVAITTPTMKDKDHLRPLTAATRRERHKDSVYGCYVKDYKTDDAQIVPWSEKRVIPLVAESRGGLSAHCRGLINLCASAAESISCPGYNPKLKAELSTKFAYNIVSAIWMNNADMIIRIPLDLPRNILKRTRERRQSSSNSNPGLTSSYSLVPTPLCHTIDLSLNGESSVCSAPVSVDISLPLSQSSRPVPAPTDPMHITCMSVAC